MLYFLSRFKSLPLTADTSNICSIIFLPKCLLLEAGLLQIVAFLGDLLLYLDET